MNDDVSLAPHDIAALVAPAIDRIFLAVMAAGHAYGGAELSQRYGGPAATGFLVDFRTRAAAPGGTVSGAGFAAVTRYRDPVECQRVLDKQVAHAMLCRERDGGFYATDRGRSFLTELYGLHAQITREIWDGHGDRVARLVDAFGVLVTAASADGGEAFHAVAPPYEPDGTPAGVLLLNRLGALRHHRADAHAAAWSAAGHSPRSIADLPSGPQRLTIELETNRRAAGPYAALAPAERLTLLADLAALPG
ncbi:hypothetical protein GCM10027290_41340 [Micromonospora sonneratiae]|uniref:Uncharacterized protein n=1 Tax=Micromonospora sonneratiae TaxID=1184706 RepID=A0ABW3YKE7_9ACTN